MSSVVFMININRESGNSIIEITVGKNWMLTTFLVTVRWTIWLRRQRSAPAIYRRAEIGAPLLTATAAGKLNMHSINGHHQINKATFTCLKLRVHQIVSISISLAIRAKVSHESLVFSILGLYGNNKFIY